MKCCRVVRIWNRQDFYIPQSQVKPQDSGPARFTLIIGVRKARLASNFMVVPKTKPHRVKEG